MVIILLIVQEKNIINSNIDMSFILHAGGVTPDGKIGSNSIEAIEYSYLRGYRVFEIDFCWTEDNKLVCVHDWDAYYAPRLGKKAVTLKEFNELKDKCYGFTSMSLDDLISFMKKNNDAIIVTDIKDDCVEGAKLLSEYCLDLKNRFYIQIYNKEEYESVSNIGFENIILTVYKMDWEEKQNAEELVAFAQEHKLLGITFPDVMINLVPNYVETLKKANIPLFVHTVNDLETQKKIFELGITGIYTDYGDDSVSLNCILIPTVVTMSIGIILLVYTKIKYPSDKFSKVVVIAGCIYIIMVSLVMTVYIIYCQLLT